MTWRRGGGTRVTDLVYFDGVSWKRIIGGWNRLYLGHKHRFGRLSDSADGTWVDESGIIDMVCPPKNWLRATSLHHCISHFPRHLDIIKPEKSWFFFSGECNMPLYMHVALTACFVSPLRTTGQDNFFFFNGTLQLLHIHALHFSVFWFLHNRCCWVCLITVPHQSARRHYFVVFGPAKKWCNSETTFPGWFFVCWNRKNWFQTRYWHGTGAGTLLCLKRPQ